VSNPYRHRVNYCLQQAGKALQASGIAQQETALFFLWRAYSTYLRELASQLNLPDRAFVSARELQDLLQADGRSAENATELVLLEAGDWAGSLQRQWQACLHPSVGEPKTAGLIVVDTAQAETALPAIHAQLEALLDRQRMTNEEW